MKRGLAAALMLVAVVTACRSETPEAASTAATPAPVASPTPDPEASNLLTLVRGAVVIDRTGENTLSTSAMNAIDAWRASPWVTPPRDPEQTVTIALGARSRVESVGIVTPAGANPPAPDKVRVELSPDGSRFSAAGEFAAGEPSAIRPVEATHLRATIIDDTRESVGIASIVVRGSETGAYVRPSIAGSWMLNGVPARFGQNGSRVWGVIEMNPPLVLEGGWSDRTIRAVWLRGMEFGYAAIFVSPDGRAMNIRRWHEEVIPLFQALPFLGTRSGAAQPPGTWSVHDTWRQRFKRVPVYGIEFDSDGVLLAEASAESIAWLSRALGGGGRHTVLVREHGEASAADNLAASQRQAESLRKALQAREVNLANVTFRGVGVTEHKETPATQVERPMFTRVELVAEQ